MLTGELGMTLDAWLKLREALVKIQQERLTWAMVCECDCAACERLSSVIRQTSSLTSTAESAK